MAKNNLKLLVGRPLLFLLLLVSAIFYVTARYKQEVFANAKIDEILFYFFNGLDGADTTTYIEAAQDNLILLAVVFGLLCIPVIDFYRNRIIMHFNFSFKNRRREVRINPSGIRLRYKLAYAAVIFVGSAWMLLSTFGVYDYVRAMGTYSELYEKEYVDPETAAIVFPEKKRNLIYIYLESVENTVMSEANGGSSPVSYMPEMEALAMDPDNINFSNTEELGGALPVHGTTWTVGALTAQSAGIPLKTFLGLDRNDMGSFSQFLPGAYTLGEVLEKQNYNQMFLIGSDAKFGGRDKLFGQHGDYQIFDFYTARERDLIADDYKVWWGYEDRRLMDYARTEVTKLAAKDEPFNFQMLTVDTHYVDGWLDPTCRTPYDQKYKNVHNCSSSQVAAFVDWIKQQEFYDNTTIIISGDHLGMQTAFYDELIGEGNDYQRTIFNVILNAPIEPIQEKERLFTTMDMYPTSLSAIGASVPGDRLGLGTDLFSDQPTLVEKYGLDYLDAELTKQSRFYNEQIMIDR